MADTKNEKQSDKLGIEDEELEPIVEFFALLRIWEHSSNQENAENSFLTDLIIVNCVSLCKIKKNRKSISEKQKIKRLKT